MDCPSQPSGDTKAHFLRIHKKPPTNTMRATMSGMPMPPETPPTPFMLSANKEYDQPSDSPIR